MLIACRNYGNLNDHRVVCYFSMVSLGWRSWSARTERFL